MLVDSALCCFITLGMFSLLLAWKSRFRQGYWVFWISLALAFLTKGLVGLAIPAVGAGAFILWQRDFGLLRRMRIVPGVLLLTVLLLAWAAILYLKGGAGFLQTFFVYNQFGRFFHSGGYISGHVQPFYYYLLSLWWDAAPWSLLIIPALIAPRVPGDTRRFLHSWFLAGLALLSLAATKRGIYLLPLFPALAAGIASWMTDFAGRVPRKWEQGLLYGLLTVVGLTALALPFAYVIKLGGAWGTACVLFGLAAAGFGAVYRYSRQALPRFVVLCLAVFVLVWASALFSQADRQKSYKDLFVRMGRIVADSPVAGYDLNESVEAFSAFYGGFHPRNIEKRAAFEEAIRERRYGYVILFEKRVDARLRSLLQAKGEVQLKDASDMRRGIELWKIGP
jgi:4-amino-4-deoxy-L-arabinose transferase-like glycosyltransferase